MADTKSSKTMAKKRFSIKDNAINKSVMNTSIDIRTGEKKEDKIIIPINEVKKNNVKESTLEEAKKNIIYSRNNPDIFYDNLRNPDFTGCEIKELEQGFNIIKKSYTQSKQRDKIWIDLGIISSNYQEKSNFDAYILGVYYGLRAYTTDYLNVLNKLFNLLHEMNKTSFLTFTEYCNNLNVLKDEKIDEDKYQKKLNDLLFSTKLLES